MALENGVSLHGRSRKVFWLYLCVCVSMYFLESNLMTKVALVFGGSIKDVLPLSSGHWKHNEAHVCSFL